MKCNYQSWRSRQPARSPLRPQPAPPLFPLSFPHTPLSFPLSFPSIPHSRSPTVAHNLYYRRAAHIINLIKRPPLKIVLLVRQLLPLPLSLSPARSATLLPPPKPRMIRTPQPLDSPQPLSCIRSSFPLLVFALCAHSASLVCCSLASLGVTYIRKSSPRSRPSPIPCYSRQQQASNKFGSSRSLVTHSIDGEALICRSRFDRRCIVALQ